MLVAQTLAAPSWGLAVTDLKLLLAVPLIPLVAYAIQLFFGKRLPRQGDWLLTGGMFVGLGIAIYELTKGFAARSPDFQVSSRAMGHGWMWFTTKAGEPNVVAGILYDNLSAAMLVVVTLVSALVHLFSIGY